MKENTPPPILIKIVDLEQVTIDVFCLVVDKAFYDACLGGSVGMLRNPSNAVVELSRRCA